MNLEHMKMQIDLFKNQLIIQTIKTIEMINSEIIVEIIIETIITLNKRDTETITEITSIENMTDYLIIQPKKIVRYFLE